MNFHKPRSFGEFDSGIKVIDLPKANALKFNKNKGTSLIITFLIIYLALILIEF